MIIFNKRLIIYLYLLFLNNKNLKQLLANLFATFINSKLIAKKYNRFHIKIYLNK